VEFNALFACILWLLYCLSFSCDALICALIEGRIKMHELKAVRSGPLYPENCTSSSDVGSQEQIGLFTSTGYQLY